MKLPRALVLGLGIVNDIFGDFMRIKLSKLPGNWWLRPLWVKKHHLWTDNGLSYLSMMLPEKPNNMYFPLYFASKYTHTEIISFVSEIVIETFSSSWIVGSSLWRVNQTAGVPRARGSRGLFDHYWCHPGFCLSRLEWG